MLKIVNIEFILYSNNEENFCLLSTDSDSLVLPNITFHNIDPVKLMDRTKEFFIEQTFSKYVSLDYKWANLRLLDCDIQSDGENIYTHIFYGCFVPRHSITKDAFWIVSNDLLKTSKIIKKILI